MVALVMLGSVGFGFWLALRGPGSAHQRHADDDDSDESGGGGGRGARDDRRSGSRHRDGDRASANGARDDDPAGGAPRENPLLGTAFDPAAAPNGGGAIGGGDPSSPGGGAGGTAIGGGAIGAPPGGTPGTVGTGLTYNGRPVLQGGNSTVPVGGSPSIPGSPSATTPTGAKDPSSDTTAPSLLSVQFQPPEVHAGDTVIALMEVVDDLAGVQAVYGRLSSPAGAALPFTAVRQADGSNVFSAPIPIPKDAQQGAWWISLISLVDKAANTSTVGYTAANALPGSILQVISANSDTQGPTVRGITLAQPSMTDGQTNTVIIDATDDKSGIASIYGTFVSAHGSGLAPFGCTITPEGGPYQCPFPIKPNADCGEWHLRELHLTDQTGNPANLDPTNSPAVAGARFTVTSTTGKCDSGKPVVRSISVSPSSMSNQVDNVLVVTVDATDDVSGVASISGRADGPRPPAGGSPPIRWTDSCSQPAPNGPWTCSMTIPKLASKGTWRIGYLQLSDNAGNIRYCPDQTDPSACNLSGGDFQVQ